MKLFISILFLCSFVLLANSQSCSEADFVLSRYGSLYLHFGPTDGRSERPIVISNTTSILTSADSLVISGGLRFQSSDPQPACTVNNKGAVFYSVSSGNRGGDQLSYCGSETSAPFWKKVDISERTFGPAVRDAWGYVFDSWDRPAANWDTARQTCSNLGGRLPTLTELARNNQLDGTSLISNYFTEGNTPSPLLWTIIPGTSAGTYMVARLSSASAADFAPAGATSGYQFRCVWPLPPSSPFADTNCYGPAGYECQGANRWYNVDRFIRASLPFSVALEECIFNGGSLPTFSAWTNFLSDPNFALDKTSSALSSLEIGVFTGGLSRVLLDFNALNPLTSRWIQQTPPTSSLPSVSSNFVCVGLSPTIPRNITVQPECNGRCFYYATSRGIVVIDENNRPAAGWLNATGNCNLLGGKIFDLPLAFELIHKGVNLPTPVWTTQAGYNIATTSIDIFTISGIEGQYWTPSPANLVFSNYASSVPYRCVWTSTIMTPESSFTCNEKQVGIEDSNHNFICLDVQPGNPNSNQFGTTFIDSFGYAWDGDHRDALNYTAASTVCQNIGARLPTPTEVFRISRLRTPLSNVPQRLPVQVADRDLDMWTVVPIQTAGRRATITAAGNSGNRGESELLKFRCVWSPIATLLPSVGIGNVFGGHKCLGEPSASSTPNQLCWRLGHLVVDSYDRVPLPYVSAAAECAFLGGRLPTFEEITRLINNGAPNGYNNFNFGATELQVNYGLWVANSGYDPSNNGYLVARWFRTQPQTWSTVYGVMTSVATATVGYSAPSTLNSYRCVWSDEL